jgi:glycosyltransferase involved in cell wall biosynthesis
VADALRVAHLGTQTGWRGGEQQQAWLAAGLQERGHACLVICNAKGEMARRAPKLGLKTVPIPVRGEIGVRSVTRSARALREFEPHVVHLHDAHAVLIGSLASKLARSPALVASRRVDFRINSRWKYTWAIDRIIAISDAVRAVLVDCGLPAEMLSVVRSGIDLSRFDRPPEREAARAALGLGPTDLAVGMVAALTDHKGHKFLLEAWPQVAAEHPRARLLLAGDGELEDELRGSAARLGIESSVRFLGYHDDVVGLLAALDLFVMSSHLEGLCTSLMDAMAAGLPVVATTAGGIPEVVEDGRTGVLVAPRDPGALAGALCAVLADPDRRAALGRAGRERAAASFGYDRMVDGTLEVYRQVQDGRAGP